MSVYLSISCSLLLVSCGLAELLLKDPQELYIDGALGELIVIILHLLFNSLLCNDIVLFILIRL
jgi:hypothetical protein